MPKSKIKNKQTQKRKNNVGKRNVNGKTVINDTTKKLMQKIHEQRISDDEVIRYLDKKYVSNTNNLKFKPGVTYRTLEYVMDDENKTPIYTVIVPIIINFRIILHAIIQNTPSSKFTKLEDVKFEIERAHAFNTYEQEPDNKIQKHNLKCIKQMSNKISKFMKERIQIFNDSKKRQGISIFNIWFIIRSTNFTSNTHTDWNISDKTQPNNKKGVVFINAQDISTKYSTYLTQKLIPAYVNEIDIESILSTPNKQFQVAIIGAGPVALCIGYILAKSTKYNVTFYEKRKIYSRDQYLVVNLNLLNSTVFTPIADLLITKGNICYIHPPSEDVLGHCYKENYYFQNIINIRISEFEKLIKKACLDTKHCKFIQREIQQTSDITKPFDILFGCEGGKSFTRNNILGSQKIHESRYKSYGIIMNYKDQTKYRYRKKTLKRRIDGINQNRYRFFRGQDRYAYLGLQLTNKEFTKQVQTAKEFKDLPKSLQKTFSNYWKIYKSKPVPILPIKDGGVNNIPVQSFQIKHVQYDKYADIVNSKLCVIAGDSVSESHFFTASGLINGLDTVNNLVNYMVYKLKHSDDKVTLNKTYKLLVNQYNLECAGMINKYWESMHNGYNRIKQAQPICKKMNSNDWSDIKKRILLGEPYQISSNKYKTIDLDWFDDDNDLCKMYANLVVNEYSHLI